MVEKINAKYILGSILAIPLLPVMYFQSKQIRASVPRLPEATGAEGFIRLGEQEVFNLIVLGESTMAGVGVKTHEEGFGGTLAKEIAQRNKAAVQWKVYARSGYTALKVKDKIIPKIAETSADLIVVGLGANDAFHLSSPRKWRRHIRSLIGDLRLKFRNAPIVFLNMPPIKEFPAFTPVLKFIVGNLVDILGEELTNVVRDYDNVFHYPKKITMREWVKRLHADASTSDFFCDGVHPSKLTYQLWASDVAEYICDNLSFQALTSKT